MKYEISQRFFFDAAHSLRRTIEVESSARIHGHTYQAEVALSGQPDPDTGMVLDLGLLRAELDRIRAQLDHRLLDDVPGIGMPTLENLCSFIARAAAWTTSFWVALRFSRDKSKCRKLTSTLVTAGSRTRSPSTNNSCPV